MRKGIFAGLSVGLVAFASPLVILANGHPPQPELLLAPGFHVKDYCLVPHGRPLNFYRDIRPLNWDGSVNSVVEIPSGTNDKFEVSESTGQMCWEIKDGAPRVVKFLGYPGNYGMIPRTLGGDGDSLDMVTLGRLERRGRVVRAKVIGVLHLNDGGDVDDKIIAVLPGTALYAVNDISELDDQFPGITTILSTWFESYKGPGEITALGFGSASEAMTVLQAAMEAYQ